MHLDQRIARATGDRTLPSMKTLFELAKPERTLAATGSDAGYLDAFLSTLQGDQSDD